MAGRPSALRNTGFTLAGQLSARLLGLVFYAVLARALGPERYGDQAFGAAVGTLFGALLEPGLNPVLVRDGARDRSLLRERLAEALGYKLLALAVVWPLSLGACAALGYRGFALWAVLFAGGTQLLSALEELAAAALTAAERLDLEGTLRFASKVLGAGLGLAAIAAGLDFAGILAAIAVGAGLTGVAGLWLVARAGIRVGPTVHVGRLLLRLRESWVLAVAGVLWMLTLRVDQILASALGLGHEALGNYGAAVKVVEALVLFPGALATAFQPRLSVAWAEGRERCSEQLQVALAGSMAATVAIAAGGACLSPGLVSLVFGGRFEATAPLLALQLFALPLIGIQFLSAHALVAAGAARAQALSTGANLGVNVVLNLVLLPRLGIAGACWSALAGGLAGSLVGWQALRSAGLRPGLARALVRPGVAAAAMWGILALSPVQQWPLLPAIAAGGATYLTVFGALGGLRVLRALAGARARPSPGAPVSPS